jgi:hypothetical protein
MPRQVKIGFDKVPSPPVKVYQQLVDTKGTPLQDAAGNPLVTEEASSIAAFNFASNSLSNIVSNKNPEDAIPVVEQFANESEVSSTLLGVNRAEEQLSLFADVSTYGYDDMNWNYYTVGEGKFPTQWYTRAHPVYGNRGFAEFHEATDEQALYLKSFPTQYRWPDHPQSSTEIISPTSNFGKYIRFIALGRWLYEVWKDVDSSFAEANFLPHCLQIVNSEREEIQITINSWRPDAPGGFFDEVDFHNVLYASDTNSSSQVAMDEIEKWTGFYYKIQNDIDQYPKYTIQTGFDKFTTFPFKTQTLTANPIPAVGQYQQISAYCSPEITRPGGDDENTSIGVLESRKSFRYQPGRVSGFTFGLRLRNNPASLADKIEWGCANDTDQYMFQVEGTKLNIVRRSTAAIPIDVLEDPNGMDLIPGTDFQPQTKEVPPSRDGSKPMYTLKIPRDKWNGDPLDGTGPSGHILKPETVTMYKIEYSWYGAIGAKFYAYVPIGSGEARWVLMHTLIIENKLPKPVLQNADFKFRYVLYNNQTSNLLQPTFIYKYGSSYYIDGGDEGTTSLTSVTSDTKTFTNPAIRGSVVALHPKKLIQSTALFDPDDVNEGIVNNKKIYPLTLSAFSTKPVRIDVLKVNVTPDGQHGTKSVSLSAGQRFEKNITFDVLSLNQISLKNTTADTFSPFDKNAKVIREGFYNIYLNPDVDSQTSETSANLASILRRNDYELRSIDIGERIEDTTQSSGIYDMHPTDTGLTRQGFTARVSGYRSVVASTTPINQNKFKIHFLNPNARLVDGSNKFFADFAIGVIGDEPNIVTENVDVDGTPTPVGALRFGSYDNFKVYPTDPTTFAEGETIHNIPGFDVHDHLHVEWANKSQDRDVQKDVDFTESDPGDGTRFEQDYRISSTDRPFNGTSGSAGVVEGVVSAIDYAIDSIDTVGVEAGSDFRVVFTSSNAGAYPPISDRTLNVAELGFAGNATGYVFTSIPIAVQVGDDTKFIAFISKTGGGATLDDFLINPSNPSNPATYDDQYHATSIQAKTITLKSANILSAIDPSKDFEVTEIYRFNIQPLYLFIAMKSNARINNIIVEEFTATTASSHVPNFIGTTDDGLFNVTGNETSNISIQKDSLTSHVFSPSNFINTNDLTSVKYDTSTGNPISDGLTLYSFYVGENEAVKFGLENIFGADREFLTPGLYNNKAIYFKAVPVASTGPNSTADVQMTVTSREQ